jgi:hypothetical protein
MPTPFAADAHAFLQEHAQDFTFAGRSFRAILDQPDVLAGAGGVSGVSRSYQLTYATGCVTLKRGDVLSGAGGNWEVREVPMAIDDGVFTQAVLSKGYA